MVTYKSIGKIKVNDTTELMISQMIEKGEVTAIYLNNYITSDKYIGPTKGVRVPAELADEYHDLIVMALDLMKVKVKAGK